MSISILSWRTTTFQWTYLPPPTLCFHLAMPGLRLVCLVIFCFLVVSWRTQRHSQQHRRAVQANMLLRTPVKRHEDCRGLEYVALVVDWTYLFRTFSLLSLSVPRFTRSLFLMCATVSHLISASLRCTICSHRRCPLFSARGRFNSSPTLKIQETNHSLRKNPHSNECYVNERVKVHFNRFLQTLPRSHFSKMLIFGPDLYARTENDTESGEVLQDSNFGSMPRRPTYSNTLGIEFIRTYAVLNVFRSAIQMIKIALFYWFMQNVCT